MFDYYSTAFRVKGRGGTKLLYQLIYMTSCRFRIKKGVGVVVGQSQPNRFAGLKCVFKRERKKSTCLGKPDKP